MSKSPKSRRPRRTPPTIDLKAASVTQAPPDPPPAAAEAPRQDAAEVTASDSSLPPETADSAPADTDVGSSAATPSAAGAAGADAPADGIAPARSGGGSAMRRSRVYGGLGGDEDGTPASAATPESGLVAADTLAFPAAATPVSPMAGAAPPAARVPNMASAGGRDARAREPAEAPARRSAGFGSLLGAGVLGGLVGAGASLLANALLTPDPRPDPRIAVLEERLGAVPPRDQIGSLERRLATLEGERTGVDERLRAAQGTAERGLARAEEALSRPAPVGDAPPAPAADAAPTTSAPAPTVVPETALAEVTARLDALEGRVRQQDAAPSAPAGTGSPAPSPETDERLAALARQVEAIANAASARGPTPEAASGAEPRLAEQDRRLAELDSRLAGIETAARERAQELASAVQGLQGSVQASEQAVRSLQGNVQGLEPSLRSLQNAVQPLPDAVGGLDRRLGEQDGRLAALARQIEGQDGRLSALGQQVQAQDGRFAEIGQRLGAQDGRLGEIAQQLRGQDERLAVLGQSSQGQDARLATLSRQFAERDPAIPIRIVAADRVAQSLEAGTPYASALDALRRLGGDPARLQALEPFAASGAPTAAALVAEFRPLAERMIREGRPPAVTLTDRLKRMAGEVVTVRSVGEPEGTDVENLVARVEGALGRGAIAEAAAAFDALPEPARAPAEAFGRTLRERAAAEGAARQVSADALAGLAAPR